MIVSLGFLAGSRTIKYAPLGQVHEVVAAGTLREAGDLEPAGLAVIAGSAVAGDSVSDDLATGAGRVQLRRVGEVTNDGDLGQRARRGGAESASGRRSRGDDGATEGGEGHVCEGSC